MNERHGNAHLDLLAEQIDQAGDESDETALKDLDKECEDLLQRKQEKLASRLWYYRANIQAALGRSQPLDPWSWRQPYLEREILYLRRAKDAQKVYGPNPVVKAQIATNLANGLNRLGRSVDALHMYDAALSEVPGFAMALANRGAARRDLAKHLHDDGHAAVMLMHAHDDLLRSASDGALWDSGYEGLKELFSAQAALIAEHVDIDRVRLIDMQDHPLGESKEERIFRRWALSHQLFLNPLNVLDVGPLAATDRFALPSYTGPAGDPPQYIAWFNQLKQEYAASRLMLFESETRVSHYADNELSKRPAMAS